MLLVVYEHPCYYLFLYFYYYFINRGAGSRLFLWEVVVLKVTGEEINLLLHLVALELFNCLDVVVLDCKVEWVHQEVAT